MSNKEDAFLVRSYKIPSREEWATVRGKWLPLRDSHFFIESDEFTLPAKEYLSRDELIREKVTHALTELRDCVVVSREIRGGIPVLKGTRMPISRILAELADDLSASQVGEDFELNTAEIQRFLGALSMYMDQSFANDRISTRQMH